MKKKSTHVKKILLVCSFLLILVILLKPDTKANTDSIITNQDKLPKTLYKSSNEGPIQIINAPSSIAGRCGEWRTFKITLENRNDKALQPNLTLSQSENLKFYYPKKFIVPPNTQRTMTFLVNFYCDNTNSRTAIDFTLSNLTKKIVFESLKW